MELLCRVQHFGGVTNFLDCTSDYLVALFFACAHQQTLDGRLILLPRFPRILWKPTPTDLRIQSQKSHFYWLPHGTISEEDPNVYIVKIPSQHKRNLLKHLKHCYNISAETLYIDLHGGISWSESSFKDSGARSPFWHSVQKKAQQNLHELSEAPPFDEVLPLLANKIAELGNS